MIWQDIPVYVQDMILFLVIILPILIIGFISTKGYEPLVLVKTMFLRYIKINMMIIIIMSISLGIGISLISQEKAFKKAMAQAANKFDLIVTAPGSQIDMMLSTVYLEPSDAPLLSGKWMDKLNHDPKVEFAVPIAYGDSFEGNNVVGSTNTFVKYLSDDTIKGSYFTAHEQAIVGAGVDLKIGDSFIPQHGHHHEEHEEHEHEHEGDHEHEEHSAIESIFHKSVSITVVGKMSATNSPWDKAIIIPIESVWEIHHLDNGHDPLSSHQLGLPFDKEHFPGTPAILVKAKKLGYNYSLQSQYSTKDTMAFFPGTVLSKLHALLNDIRQIMSIISSLSLFLVILGIITTLILLGKLFSSRFALLRAIGAPKRFIFSVMWLYTVVLISCSSILGMLFAYISTSIISSVISKNMNIMIDATLSWDEFHLIALFFTTSVLLGLIPAVLAFRQSVLKNIRGI